MAEMGRRLSLVDGVPSSTDAAAAALAPAPAHENKPNDANNAPDDALDEQAGKITPRRDSVLSAIPPHADFDFDDLCQKYRFVRFLGRGMISNCAPRCTELMNGAAVQDRMGMSLKP